MILPYYHPDRQLIRVPTLNIIILPLHLQLPTIFLYNHFQLTIIRLHLTHRHHLPEDHLR